MTNKEKFLAGHPFAAKCWAEDQFYYDSDFRCVLLSSDKYVRIGTVHTAPTEKSFKVAKFVITGLVAKTVEFKDLIFLEPCQNK